MATGSSGSTFSRPSDGGSAAYNVSGSGLNQNSGGTENAFVTAKASGAFFEFTLKPDGGNTLDLSSLSFDVAYKAGNLHSFRVLVTSSLTGDSFGDRLDIGDSSGIEHVLQDDLGEIGVSVPGNRSWAPSQDVTATLSDSVFTGASEPVTFRIYAFTINSPIPIANDLLRFDNISVEGTVVAEPESASAVSEHSSGVLIGIGGLSLILRSGN